MFEGAYKAVCGWSFEDEMLRSVPVSIRPSKSLPGERLLFAGMRTDWLLWHLLRLNLVSLCALHL